MRRVVASLAIIAAIWVSSPFAQSRQLRLVSTVWPPFTNERALPRFALDLVEAATNRYGVVTTTAIVDAPAFTSALLKGPYDGSAAAWKDAEREKVLLFSQPYLENRLVLVGQRGSDVSATGLAALKGKRIAIVDGYSYGDVETSGPTFVRSKSEEDSLRLLLQGGADYTLMDELVVQYIVEHYAKEAQTRLQLGTQALVTRPLFFAVRRSLPDAQSIIDRFNGQLRSMIIDRTYHRLLHVTWINADVDGDGRPEYIAQDDRTGPLEPSRAYTLLSNAKAETPTPEKKSSRFYFGGNIYTSWAEVPDSFKRGDNQQPDASRSTASIFSFNW